MSQCQNTIPLGINQNVTFSGDLSMMTKLPTLQIKHLRTEQWATMVLLGVLFSLSSHSKI